jgi:rhodanese-related sulfurtransferase
MASPRNVNWAVCGGAYRIDGFDLTKRDQADENGRSLAEHTTTHEEPPPIRQLSAPDLKALLESGAAIELVDVRTEEERATATIDGSRLLDQAYHDALLLRDRDTPIVFQCHHGVRSQQAAEYFRRQGFRNLYNLRGGIDAWSLLVDTSVPRY